MKFQFALLIAMLVAANAVAENPVIVGIAKPTDNASIDQIDHSELSLLLGQFVDEDGNVNYRDWKSSAKNRRALTQYLESLSYADPSQPASREATIAFWVNAYNALTIEGILRVYPIASVRELRDVRGEPYDFWDNTRLYVAGKAYSLNDIEHKVLRPLTEPRIHFAIVCGSKSCPRLSQEAYSAPRLEQQLDESAKHFLKQPGNFAFVGNSIQAASIFDWFGKDFGDDEREVTKRLHPWLPQSSQSKLDATNPPLKFSEYDWSLNEK